MVKLQEVEVEEVNEIPTKTTFKLKKDGTPKKTSLKSNLVGGKTKKELSDLGKKANKASQLAREQKTPIRDILNQTLTNPVRRKIAKEYVEILTDKEVKVSERIKLLELILKLMGELENNKATLEVNEVDNTIKLEIT